jgi:hypothetical protein
MLHELYGRFSVSVKVTFYRFLAFRLPIHERISEEFVDLILAEFLFSISGDRRSSTALNRHLCAFRLAVRMILLSLAIFL